MYLFNGIFVSLNCPNCSYAMDIELVSVRLQERVFCPCCKMVVQLLDSDASVHGAQKRMELALRRFGRET